MTQKCFLLDESSTYLFQNLLQVSISFLGGEFQLYNKSVHFINDQNRPDVFKPRLAKHHLSLHNTKTCQQRMNVLNKKNLFRAFSFHNSQSNESKCLFIHWNIQSIGIMYSTKPSVAHVKSIKTKEVNITLKIQLFYCVMFFKHPRYVHFYISKQLYFLASQWRHSAATVPEDTLLQQHQQPQWLHHTA